MKNTIITLGIFLIAISGFSQTYGDPSFYLVDSLDLDKLGKYDKNILNKYLTKINETATSKDSLRFSYIKNIVEQSSSLNVLYKYNSLLHKSINKTLLKKNLSAQEIKRFKMLDGHYFMNQAYYFKVLEEFDSALHYNDSALKLYDGIDYHTFDGNIYNLSANTLNKKGLLNEAIQTFNKGIKSSEKIGDTTTLGLIYQNLGTIHYTQENYEEAIESFSKAIIYSKANSIKDVWASALNNRAAAKMAHYKDTVGAKKDAFEALSIFKNSHSNYYSMQSYELIGKIEYGEKNYKISQNYYDTMLSIAELYNTKSYIARAKIGLARVHKRTKQYNIGEKYAQEALTLSKQVKSQVLMSDSYFTLSEISEFQRDYKNAYYNYVYASKNQDSVRNKKNKKAIIKQSIEYDYQKKKELDELKQKQDLALVEAEKKQSQTAFYSALIIVLLLIIGAFLLYSRYRIIRNQKKNLNEAYELLEESKKNELAVSNLKALQSQMNPHFIFNSLNAIQDLVLQEDTDKSYDYITLFAQLVRSTLNYSDKEFINIDKELEFLDVYLSLEKLRFGEELTYKISYYDDKEIKVSPLIIQPFIENALLHGLLHKKGQKELNINFILGEQLVCEIIDNGVGRDKSSQIKKNQHTVHESFSTGAIKKRMEILSKQYNMDVRFNYEDLYENNEASGTKVTIHIPFERF
jgi:tetratricopeptide (TPR) repeat protein